MFSWGCCQCSRAVGVSISDVRTYCTLYHPVSLLKMNREDTANSANFFWGRHTRDAASVVVHYPVSQSVGRRTAKGGKRFRWGSKPTDGRKNGAISHGEKMQRSICVRRPHFVARNRFKRRPGRSDVSHLTWQGYLCPASCKSLQQQQPPNCQNFGHPVTQS